jgi:hypothetical protein
MILTKIYGGSTMAIGTTAGWGPNLAAAAGDTGGGQSGTGASQGATGNENAAGGNAAAATSIPGGGSATGNQTGGEQSPANIGLAKVLVGGPEAGAGGATGNENATGGNAAAATSLPDQSAGQPKGKPGTNQSNDNVTVPSWANQLSKKLLGNPESLRVLQAFKSLDEFVQAYLDAPSAAGGGTPAPEGKPAKAEDYRFAREEPLLAQAAFDADLSGSQAEALYQVSRKQLESMRNAVQASLARDIQTTDAALQKEYGARYEEALALMGRGLGNNPKTGEQSPIARALMEAGLAAKPEIVRAFIELGRATSEGQAAGGSYAAGMPESVMNGRGFRYADTY